MSSDHRNPQRNERSAASPSEGALTVVASGNTLAPQLHAVIGLWANATTGDGLRKRDLLRDKEQILTSSSPLPTSRRRRSTPATSPPGSDTSKRRTTRPPRCMR